MNEEKQIEEMAMVICTDCVVGQTRCKFYTKPCDVVRQECEVLYNAGYRKQSAGEWLQSDIPQEKYVCSVCGGACWYYDYQGEVAKSRFCPNCGARMRGENNG